MDIRSRLDGAQALAPHKQPSSVPTVSGAARQVHTDAEKLANVLNRLECIAGRLGGNAPSSGQAKSCGETVMNSFEPPLLDSFEPPLLDSFELGQKRVTYLLEQTAEQLGRIENMVA